MMAVDESAYATQRSHGHDLANIVSCLAELLSHRLARCSRRRRGNQDTSAGNTSMGQVRRHGSSSANVSSSVNVQRMESADV